MRRGGVRLTAAALVLAAAAGCKGPAVPHPLTGQTRYLCCNLHYEKTEISDVNFQQGTVVPFGTNVQILEVGRRSVQFQPSGYPAITLVLRYGKEVLPMDQYLDRLFLPDDPRAKLRRVPAATVKLIEQGSIDVGMTRDQVLMALGYPPAHRTPSLESPQWRYWENRWHQFVVYFDGDKVSRVQL
jgi:outer membrane protein assembly factor BamE (lipoprotein component of BamABCDE complex)